MKEKRLFCDICTHGITKLDNYNLRIEIRRKS